MTKRKHQGTFNSFCLIRIIMDLSQFFLTKSQATDFATRLNGIIDTMYTTDFNLEKSLSSQFSIVKRDAFLKLMRENNVNTGSVNDLQDFFKKIQEGLSNIPVVSLTVAFEPSEETLRTFSQWFVSNINKQVLFDIHIDPSIIAGVQITYNGKFKDYSIAPVFTDFLSHMLTSLPQHSAQTTPISTHQSAEHITVGR